MTFDYVGSERCAVEMSEEENVSRSGDVEMGLVGAILRESVSAAGFDLPRTYVNMGMQSCITRNQRTKRPACKILTNE